MLPYLWRRLLRAVRAALAACALAGILLAGGRWMALPFAAYLCYALAEIFWRSLEESGHQNAALAVDAAYFFLALWIGGVTGEWISLLFFVYVMAVAVLAHSWWVAPAIAGAAAAVIFAVPQTRPSVLLPVFAACGALAAALALDRRALQKRLAKLGRQSVLYRYDAEKARSNERQRIAADFHDGPLQSFVAFQMRLEVVRKLLTRDLAEAERELRELQAVTTTQSNDLRAFVKQMRPPEVGDSLSASISRLVEQFQRESGIPSTFGGAGHVEPPEPEISLDLLQIAREALHNIQKHSAATQVSVRMQRSGDVLEMAIEDNGGGFPFCGQFNLEELELLRMGPASIKRRARSLGAELLIDSKPGEGAGLTIRLIA